MLRFAVSLVAILVMLSASRRAGADAPVEEVDAAKRLESVGARLTRKDGRITGVDFLRSRATADNVKELGRFPELATVGTGPIALSDAIIADLAAIPKLVALRVSARDSGAGLSHLDRLVKVTSLAIVDPIALDDKVLAQIRFPARLESLTIPGSELTDDGLASLESLDHLQQLDLDAYKVTDAGLHRLRGLKKMRRLQLKGTGATGAALLDLPWRGELERLGGQFFDDERLRYLEGLSKLTHLDLQLSKVTDAGLMHMPKLPALRVLNLGSTSVTGTGMSALAGIDTLEEINLTSCTAVTDEALSKLERMQNLKRLFLFSTPITPAGAKALKKAIPDVTIDPPNLLE